MHTFIVDSYAFLIGWFNGAIDDCHTVYDIQRLKAINEVSRDAFEAINTGHVLMVTRADTMQMETKIITKEEAEKWRKNSKN